MIQEKASVKKDKEKGHPIEKTAETHVTKQKERDTPEKVRYELKMRNLLFSKTNLHCEK